MSNAHTMEIFILRAIIPQLCKRLTITSSGHRWEYELTKDTSFHSYGRAKYFYECMCIAENGGVRKSFSFILEYDMWIFNVIGGWLLNDIKVVWKYTYKSRWIRIWISWWRHETEKLSALLSICVRKPFVMGGFPHIITFRRRLHYT